MKKILQYCGIAKKQIFLYFNLIILTLSGCYTPEISQNHKNVYHGIAWLHSEVSYFQFAPFLFDKDTNIYGLNIGLVGETDVSYGIIAQVLGYNAAKEAAGIALTPIAGCGDYTNDRKSTEGCFYGIQTSAISDVMTVDGVSMNVITSRSTVKGLSISAFSIFQEVYGVGIGGVNLCSRAFVHIGAINYSETLLQIGAININTPKVRTLQIGGLNFNATGFLPVCPIINF